MKETAGAPVRGIERGKRGGETVSASRGWSLLVLIGAPPVILES